MGREPGVGTDRPPCACHGEPCDRSGSGSWTCPVSRRARQLAAYHANPREANFNRYMRALRARIRAKEHRLRDLEDHITELMEGTE